jgi:gliding motility-associated-like protein
LIDEDVAYQYTFAATDVDASDVLTYTARELPEWLTFNPETGILTGTPTNDEVGNHTVTLRVTDATAQVDQSFTITVTNVNDAPTITSTAFTVAKETFNYSYTITAIDADAGSELTFSASALPAWLTFNNDTGTLQGTPTPSEEGTYLVILSVSDGLVTVEQAFTITVSRNISPVVDANQTFSIDEKSGVHTNVGLVLATDEDGTVFMNWSIVDGNTEDAFSINSATGELVVNNETVLDFEKHSSLTLTVTVSDGFSTSLPVEITITLNDVMEGLAFYSAFSPNGDAINDTWEIDGLEAYPNSHIKIFNADGVEMFNNVGYTAQWDGFHKGKEMPLGTYFYLINLNDGSKKTLNGHFMIIK